MKMKKVLCLTLALILALSLSMTTTAFASSSLTVTAETGTEFTIEAQNFWGLAFVEISSPGHGVVVQTIVGDGVSTYEVLLSGAGWWSLYAVTFETEGSNLLSGSAELVEGYGGTDNGGDPGGRPGGVEFRRFPNWENEMRVNPNSTVNFHVHAFPTQYAIAEGYTSIVYEWWLNGQIWSYTEITPREIGNSGFWSAKLQLEGRDSSRYGTWQLIAHTLVNGTVVFTDYTSTIVVTPR